LWVGGLILNNPFCQFFIICLSRKYDEDRAPRFYNTLKILKADGIMGDLDDGPNQIPLEENVVEQLILNLLPKKQFEIIITHNPQGEYTKHLRHEETSKAVIKLWKNATIKATELWLFAYEDGHKSYYPIAAQNATAYFNLSKEVWQKKYSIITETYGFSKDSWEAKTTPKKEAFIELKLSK